MRPLIYPVESLIQFDIAFASIVFSCTRWPYSYSSDVVREGFEAAFAKALLNVQTFPEAYPRVEQLRRFWFTYRSVEFTAFYEFDGRSIILTDIDYAQGGKVASRLSGK